MFWLKHTVQTQQELWAGRSVCLRGRTSSCKALESVFVSVAQMSKPLSHLVFVALPNLGVDYLCVKREDLFNQC